MKGIIVFQKSKSWSFWLFLKENDWQSFEKRGYNSRLECIFLCLVRSWKQPTHDWVGDTKKLFAIEFWHTKWIFQKTLFSAFKVLFRKIVTFFSIRVASVTIWWMSLRSKNVSFCLSMNKVVGEIEIYTWTARLNSSKLMRSRLRRLTRRTDIFDESIQLRHNICLIQIVFLRLEQRGEILVIISQTSAMFSCPWDGQKISAMEAVPHVFWSLKVEGTNSHLMKPFVLFEGSLMGERGCERRKAKSFENKNTRKLSSARNLLERTLDLWRALLNPMDWQSHHDASRGLQCFPGSDDGPDLPGWEALDVPDRRRSSPAAEARPPPKLARRQEAQQLPLRRCSPEGYFLSIECLLFGSFSNGKVFYCI